MITQYITLDFTRKYLAPIYINQYEVDSRDFIITCTAGSLPINLADATVVFYAKKPDGTILFNSCTVVDAAAGKIQYTPTEQTCSVAGVLSCWIEIVKTDAVLRSMEFTVTVNTGTDDSGAIESASEFTALQEALGVVASLTGEEDLSAFESTILTAVDDAEAALASTIAAYNDIAAAFTVANEQWEVA